MRTPGGDPRPPRRRGQARTGPGRGRGAGAARWPAALLLLGAAACAPSALYRTAEPLPPGAWQLSGGLGLGRARDVPQQTASATVPLELGARRGVAPGVDVGLRAFVPGLGVDATWRVHRAGAWSVALAPLLAVARTPRTASTTLADHLFASVTLPVTWRGSPRWAATVGPLVGAGAYRPETGGHATGAWLGVVAGLEWRLCDRWWLVPEVSGYRVVSGEVPVAGSVAQLGVGVRLGL